MTSLDYSTRGRPAGDTIYYLENYEERGVSQESFDGKHVITGAHNRPIVLENDGDNIVAHQMGIKRPLVAPEVTVGAGLLTGDVQVAVQRVHRATQTRGGISPTWPRANELVTNGDYSWGGIANKGVFGLGAGLYYNVAWKSTMSTLLANTKSEIPYGAEAVSQTQLLINAISFYGYVPDKEGVAAPAPDVRAAIFSGTAGALVQVSPWVFRQGSDLPIEAQKSTNSGSPNISFTFESPVLLDGSDDTVYWFVIQTLDVSKTLYLATQAYASGEGRLNYSTTEAAATATFTEHTTQDKWLESKSTEVLSSYLNEDVGYDSSAYALSDVKIGEDSDGAEWIYVALSPVLDRASSRYLASALKVVRFKRASPSNPETMEIPGVGWSKICPDPANNGNIYIATERPTYPGIPAFPPFQREVVVYRRNFATTANDSDSIYSLGPPSTNSFRMDSVGDGQPDRIVAFNPVVGGGGMLLFRYTNANAPRSALVRFNSDFSSMQANSNVTTYNNFNDIHSDPNTANLFFGYTQTAGGKGQAHHLTFTQAGGLTSGPTAVSGVSGNDNIKGVMAIDPTSSPTVAYSSSDAGSIEKGTSGTSSWAKTTPATLAGLTIVGLAVSAQDANYVHAVVENSAGKLMPYYSSDAGVTWALYGSEGITEDLVSNERVEDGLVSHIQPAIFGIDDEACFHLRNPVVVSSREQETVTIIEYATQSQGGGQIAGGFSYNISDSGSGLLSIVNSGFGPTLQKVATFSDDSEVFGSRTAWINQLGGIPFSSAVLRLYGEDQAVRLEEYAASIGSPIKKWTARATRGQSLLGGSTARVIYKSEKPVGPLSVTLSLLAYTAEVKSSSPQAIEVLHGIERSLPASESELLFRRVSGASLSVSTSDVVSLEPESEMQGGAERFDALAILVRAKALGSNFWEVAQIELGDEYTFNERIEALAVKRAIHDGFFDTPGGFESVANVRNGTDERLAFAGQAGFDPFVGIPGSDDYDIKLDDFNIVRTLGALSILPKRVGRISGVDSSTSELTISSVDVAAWGGLQAGDILPILNEATGAGGFISIAEDFDPSTQPVSGVYKIEYTDYSKERPTINMSVFAPYGRGSISTVSANATELTNWHERLFITQFTGDETGILSSALRGASTQICAGGYFYGLRSYAENALSGYTAILTPSRQGFAASPVPAAGALVRTLAPIYESLRQRVALFTDARGHEVCRAFIGSSSTTDHIQPFTDKDLQKNGVRGADPSAATAIEFRKRLTCSVKKGDSVIYFNRDAANDFWHQRRIIIDGDNYDLGFIDKVMDYNPESGALLRTRGVHLSSPWQGNTHVNSPCIIAGDYSSVHFTGTSLDEPESLSGLTKLSLVPKYRTAVLAPTNGALYTFCEKDEYFRLNVPSFAIPRTGEEFINFAIEELVSTQRQRATFTTVSTKHAVDNAGNIYLVGPSGLQIFNGGSIQLVQGMRRMFSKISADSLRRASLAFDACAFPRPMLRLAGLAYEGAARTEQIGYFPELGTWVNLGGQATIDALCPISNQDSISSAAFIGAGALGIYSDMDRKTDHTDYAGPVEGQALTQYGQGAREALHGYIRAADIAVFDADESIYSIDITYKDAAAQGEKSDVDSYLRALNAPVSDGAGIVQLEKPVSFQKFNARTGVVEEAQVVGIKSDRANDGVFTYTLYVRGAMSDVSAARYYWMAGGRKWSLIANEITPAKEAKSVQIKGIAMDVSPRGSSDRPWWVKLEVFGTRGSEDIDWDNPQITRVISHTRFLQDSRQVIPIQSGFLRSGAVRLSGYAPANEHQIIKRIEIHIEDTK